MFLKPGKKDEAVDSYRPISLLPITSKIFKRVILVQINPIIAEKQLLPDIQFDSRSKHSIVKQVVIQGHVFLNKLKRNK